MRIFFTHIVLLNNRMYIDQGDIIIALYNGMKWQNLRK